MVYWGLSAIDSLRQRTRLCVDGETGNLTPITETKNHDRLFVSQCKSEIVVYLCRFLKS